MSILDIRKAKDLVIKADWKQNFSVLISGITTLDANYVLKLAAGQQNVVYQVGSGITLTAGTPNVITIAFTGVNFTKSKYEGTLESVNKNADTFLRLDVTLELT